MSGQMYEATTFDGRSPVRAPAAPADFARRLRSRERVAGYWVSCDNPVATERLAGLGYDYIGVDGQHGVVHQPGWRAALTAIDARGRSAGVVRVGSADPIAIGAALDVGARGVVVPMVRTAEEAAVAARACRHAPHGTRSIAGPVRAELRVGATPAEIDDAVACLVMIETAGALEQLDEICATPGLDAVYVGPADLSISLGAREPGDPAVAGVFDDALERIARAAERAGIAAGIHTPDGETAALRLAQGFTCVTISDDLTHVVNAAGQHLATAAAQLDAPRPAGVNVG